MANRKNGHTPGFRLPPETALLKFHGPYEGAEARVRIHIPLELALKLQGLDGESTDGATLLELYGEIILVDWNLQDADGKPLPPTAEGMTHVPAPLRSLLYQGWNQAVQEVSPPLAEPSGDGSTLEAVSIVMGKQ